MDDKDRRLVAKPAEPAEQLGAIRRGYFGHARGGAHECCGAFHRSCCEGLAYRPSPLTCVHGQRHRAAEIAPADRNPRVPDLAGYTITKVLMQAGDLVVWDTLLPHGNGHNVSGKPRLAQYITMSPAQEDEELRQARIRSWRERLPGPRFPGDPRKLEEREGTTADLTPLGRKLLGLDRWE